MDKLKNVKEWLNKPQFTLHRRTWLMPPDNTPVIIRHAVRIKDGVQFSSSFVSTPAGVGRLANFEDDCIHVLIFIYEKENWERYTPYKFPINDIEPYPEADK